MFAAFSFDGGASWGTARRVDEGRPLGRVDIELLPDGGAVLTWLESGPQAAEVRA